MNLKAICYDYGILLAALTSFGAVWMVFENWTQWIWPALKERILDVKFKVIVRRIR